MNKTLTPDHTFANLNPCTEFNVIKHLSWGVIFVCNSDRSGGDIVGTRGGNPKQFDDELLCFYSYADQLDTTNMIRHQAMSANSGAWPWYEKFVAINPYSELYLDLGSKMYQRLWTLSNDEFISQHKRGLVLQAKNAIFENLNKCHEYYG